MVLSVNSKRIYTHSRKSMKIQQERKESMTFEQRLFSLHSFFSSARQRTLQTIGATDLENLLPAVQVGEFSSQEEQHFSSVVNYCDAEAKSWVSAFKRWELPSSFQSLME